MRPHTIGGFHADTFFAEIDRIFKEVSGHNTIFNNFLIVVDVINK